MNILQAELKDSFVLSALLSELGYGGTESFIEQRLAQLSQLSQQSAAGGGIWQPSTRFFIDAFYSATGSGRRIFPVKGNAPNIEAVSGAGDWHYPSRFSAEGGTTARRAGPLSPFVSQHDQLTTIMSVHVPAGQQKALNVLIAIRNGEIISAYEKLHHL